MTRQAEAAGRASSNHANDPLANEVITTEQSTVGKLLEAVALGNLWNDRRQRQVPFEGADRRAGLDRRQMSRRAAANQRGTSTRYTIAKSVKLHAAILMAGDLIIFGISFMIAFAVAFVAQDSLLINESLLGGRNWGMLADVARFKQFVAATLIAVLLFLAFGHYTRRRPFWDELHDTTKLILIFAAVEATITFLAGWRMPRWWLIGTWLVAIPLIPLGRYFIKKTLMQIGWWGRPTVIIGYGRNARDTAEAMDEEPALGFRVAAFLVPPAAWCHICSGAETVPASIAIKGRSIPVRRLGESPEVVLKILGTPHVVVALESDDLWEVSKLLLGKDLPYSSLNIVPSIRGLPLMGMDMLHLFKHEVMMLRVQNNLARHIPQRIKRLFDLVVSCALALLLALPMLVVAMTIRLSGPGVLFGHTRIGKNGKPFKCYKFRTMVPNASQVLNALLESDPVAREEWERDFKLRKDPRITAVGTFLRKTSLDELPQLWNVIQGEMSLVGPRPVTEAELHKYGARKEFFLEARPGITGLWQVSGRNDVSYEERVRLDAWYARNWQLWFDLVILLKTVKVVLTGKSAY